MIRRIPGLDMFIIYDLIIAVFALVYLPVYLFKGKFHSGFKMRLGILPSGLELNQPIWIHAVSVGEAMAARNLAKELRLTYPHKRFFITTVTPTGNKIARGFAKENDFVAYFPLDLSFIVRSVVEKIKPCLFIVMETEIWPNLILSLYHKKIPVVVVNGRLSDRSFKGYNTVKFLLNTVLNKINLFCVQTSSDQERLLRLGVDKDRIHVTGNMKFDNADYSNRNILESSDKYKALLGLNYTDKLWVCGSTHPGEEEIILGVYKQLLEEFSGLKLLIAPRHPERAGKIQEMVSGYSLYPVLFSRFPYKSCNDMVKPVFILDMIGELVNFYNIADIVFVGGSLVKKGGQNILEPASLGKPVITGPYMFNFRDIASLFTENNACILARNGEELLENMKILLSNPDNAKELGERARQVVLENRGATTRNMGFITKRIFLSLFIIMLSLIFFVSISPAQTKDDIKEEALEAAKTDVVHTAESYVRYMPSRHEYGAQGKIGIMESAAEYGYEFKAFGKLPVKFSVGSSYIGINDTQGTIELPAHLVGVTTDIETTLPFFNFNKTYLGVGISPSFFGDDWTFNADAFRIPSRYFLIYQPDKKWTFLAGVAYYPDFTYSVIPIAGVIYKPNDKLIFDLTPRRPNITYSFNDKVSVFIEGSAAFDEFTVTRGNIKNIALQYRQTQVGSGIKLKLNRYLQAYLSAGGAFNRYFEYTDSQGKVNLKNGLYTQFRIEIGS